MLLRVVYTKVTSRRKEGEKDIRVLRETKDDCLSVANMITFSL
jgi:hypothetical protein